MPHLPRVPVFPIAGEKSLLTTGGSSLRIPAKEKSHPFIGKLAPEIQLKDHKDRLVSLHATIALGRPIVLYFFPLAGSPHCTKESCSFRDALGVSPIFNDLNVIVIGISQDHPDRQKKFVDEHQLNFRVLHDEGREVMNAWSVGRTMLGLVDARCTFIIDHVGTVRAMAEGVWDYAGHLRFAESWLVRIEDDLAGRERFYLPLPEDASGVEPAGNEGEAPVRVIYGDSGSGMAGGVGVAPRYGAATRVNKRRNSVHHAAYEREHLTTSSNPGAKNKVASSSASTGGLKSSKSKKNLREWFSPKMHGGAESFDEPVHVEGVPPVPPMRHRPFYTSMERSSSARELSAGGSRSSSDANGTSTAETSVGGYHHSRNGSDSAPPPQSMANYILAKRENRFYNGPGPGVARPQRLSGASNETSSDGHRPRSRQSKVSGPEGVSRDVSYDDHIAISPVAGSGSGGGLSPPPAGQHGAGGRSFPASLDLPFYRPRTADSAYHQPRGGLYDWTPTGSSSNLNLDGSPRGTLPPLPRPARRVSTRRRPATATANGDAPLTEDRAGTRTNGERDKRSSPTPAVVSGISDSERSDAEEIPSSILTARRVVVAKKLPESASARPWRQRSSSERGITASHRSGSESVDASELQQRPLIVDQMDDYQVVEDLRGLGIVDGDNDFDHDLDHVSQNGLAASRRRSKRLSRTLPEQSPVPEYAPPCAPSCAQTTATDSATPTQQHTPSGPPSLAATPRTSSSSPATSPAQFTPGSSHEEPSSFSARLMHQQQQNDGPPLSASSSFNQSPFSYPSSHYHHLSIGHGSTPAGTSTVAAESVAHYAPANKAPSIFDDESSEHEAWDCRSIAESFRTFGSPQFERKRWSTGPGFEEQESPRLSVAESVNASAAAGGPDHSEL